MINFVSASGHGEPLRHLLPTLTPPARRWDYERLVRRRTLPAGTWIFTDHERLSAFELNVAAAVAEQLRQAGSTVLNHPAEVRGRFALLDVLRREGINDFRAWRADESPTPSRFPVFVRRDFDHDVSGRDLLQTQSDLDAALAGLRASGVPLAGRLVIEFASSEASPGIWVRGSAYRVGDALIAHHMALDDTWLVKDGFGAEQLGSCAYREVFLARESAFVMRNEHADVLRRGFELAGIGYGRADFGFLDDRIQIYEINTNPSHGSEEEVFGHIHPGRTATQRFSEDRLHEALNALDGPSAGTVRLRGRLLHAQRHLFPLRALAMRRP